MRGTRTTMRNRTTRAQNQVYDLGPYIPITALAGHYSLLRKVLSLRPDGIAMEFGVGGGESTRLIAHYLPVYGFDSFDGLPEDWRDGYPRGSFAQPHQPDVPGATLVPGLFADTLPRIVWDGLRTVGLVHIDCDLYSSTATVLEHIGPHLRPGCYVVFDEWHGYDGAAQHEQRAWREFADRSGIGWTVIGHSIQQWGIRIV